MTSDVWGLRDPTLVDSEVRAYVIRHEVERQELSETYRPAGRALPIVETEGITGEDGRIRFYLGRHSERAPLLALLRARRTLLLQSPVGERKWVRLTESSDSPEDALAQVVDAQYVQVERPTDVIVETD